MVNVNPLAAEIRWRVWDTTANFNAQGHVGSKWARH